MESNLIFIGSKLGLMDRAYLSSESPDGESPQDRRRGKGERKQRCCCCCCSRNSGILWFKLNVLQVSMKPREEMGLNVQLANLCGISIYMSLEMLKASPRDL